MDIRFNPVFHFHKRLEDLLPARWHPYLRLIRWDRPTGTWLLLLPCLWSVALAAHKLPNIGIMFLFVLGAFVMRGAGCVVNDLYDRKLDAAVERTRDRPLASGEIEVWQAVLFLVALLLIAFCILLTFNRFTVGLGCSSLILVFVYPLMKRVTWWPQLFLGFTFNWGALMGWSAVTGTIGLPTIPLYIAGIFWTLGYDTIYAYQDIRDDEHAGIKSTARLLGDASRPWVVLFYTMAILFLAIAGLADNLSTTYFYLLLVAALYAVVQLFLWRMSDPENCRLRFNANRNFGFIVLAAIILGKWI